MARDYRADFQAFVDQRMPSGDYVLPVLAADLVTELRKTDPALLRGWLDANAAQFVTQVLGDKARSDRGRRASDAPRSAFADAADRFTGGDEDALKPFDLHFVVGDDMVRRRLGDMTKADHIYVAGEHTKRSNAALFESAFHKAVAKRIPAGKTTQDVMDEQEYLRLRSSIRAPKSSAA
jgi:hypothetical protein